MVTAKPVSPWRFVRRRSTTLGVSGYWVRRMQGGVLRVGPTVPLDAN